MVFRVFQGGDVMLLILGCTCLRVHRDGSSGCGHEWYMNVLSNSVLGCALLAEFMPTGKPTGKI